MSSSLMPDKLENILQSSLHLPKQWIQISPPFLYFAQQDFHLFLEKKKKKRLKRMCFGNKVCLLPHHFCGQPCIYPTGVQNFIYIPPSHLHLDTLLNYQWCPILHGPVWYSSSNTFLAHAFRHFFCPPPLCLSPDPVFSDGAVPCTVTLVLVRPQEPAACPSVSG